MMAALGLNLSGGASWPDIVMLDGEHPFAEDLVREARLAGCTVRWATTVGGALKKISDSPKHRKLVLVAVRNHLGDLRAVLKRFKHLPRLVVLARTGRSEVLEVMEAGATLVLLQPCTLGLLLEKAAEAVKVHEIIRAHGPLRLSSTRDLIGFKEWATLPVKLAREGEGDEPPETTDGLLVSPVQGGMGVRAQVSWPMGTKVTLSSSLFDTLNLGEVEGEVRGVEDAASYGQSGWFYWLIKYLNLSLENQSRVDACFEALGDSIEEPPE